MSMTLDLDNSRRRIPVNDRVDFADQMLGTPNYLRFENILFDTMNRLCKQYANEASGYWEMYQVGKNCFYMTPVMRGPLQVNAEGQMEFLEMSPDAAGLGVSIWALGELVNRTQDESIYDLYENLRDYAEQHDESSAIFRLLD